MAWNQGDPSLDEPLTFGEKVYCHSLVGFCLFLILVGPVSVYSKTSMVEPTPHPYQAVR